MDDDPAYSGLAKFPYKSYWEHLRDFVRSPLPIIVVAVAIFGALWTFGEAAVQFVGADPRGLTSYLLLIIGSVVASVAWNGYLYCQRIPEGFEHVSRKASRIAHWQRPLWEFRLAKTVLAEKIGPHDRELRDLTEGRSFVLAEKPESLHAYIQWVETRIPNLLNMLAVSENLLTAHLPAALFSTTEKTAEPLKILEAIETIARFYEATVAFERSSRSVMTSEALQRLHDLQLGWSEPIRDGIHQLFRLLQRLCECDPKGHNPVKFEIVMNEPKSLPDFLREMDRLGPLIPKLAEEW